MISLCVEHFFLIMQKEMLCDACIIIIVKKKEEERIRIYTIIRVCSQELFNYTFYIIYNIIIYYYYILYYIIMMILSVIKVSCFKKKTIEELVVSRDKRASSEL